MDKLYYTVGEAATMLGVAPSTLRYWDRRGVLVPSKRESGRRYYTASDIEKGRRVAELARAGYTLEGAARRLRRGSGVAPEIVEELRDLLHLVRKLRGRP